MIYLTKRFEFSASHKLAGEGFSDEENRQVYGNCANDHGHTYFLEVTVAGKPDSKNGMLVNLDTLKETVEKELIQKVDHCHLNRDVSFLNGTNPTMENLIKKFWTVLKDKIPGGKLYELKLYETEKNFASYRGE